MHFEIIYNFSSMKTAEQFAMLCNNFLHFSQTFLRRNLRAIVQMLLKHLRIKLQGSSFANGNYCWLVRVSLFIELGCPRDLGTGPWHFYDK